MRVNLVEPPAGPPLVVVMGVSGSGKSRIGAMLAERLGVDYVDGDDLHSPAAIAKMASGLPLTDEDRGPWLRAVAGWLAQHSSQGGVVSCSALRRRYRSVLVGEGAAAVFLHLHGAPELLRERMQGREHFMRESMLETQLLTLEPLQADENGVCVDVAAPPEEIVSGFLALLGRS